MTEGEATAIEVKASKKESSKDFKGLRALNEEGGFKKLILISQGPINTKDGIYQALYWEEFLDCLWNDEYL